MKIMHNIFAYMVLTIFLFISTICYAAEQWTNVGTIEGIWIDTRSASAKFLFRHSHQINPGNCVHNGAFYELNNDGSTTTQAAISLLLSAEAQQDQIRVYLSGCSSTGRPVAVLVDTVL